MLQSPAQLLRVFIAALCIGLLAFAGMTNPGATTAAQLNFYDIAQNALIAVLLIKVSVAFAHARQAAIQYPPEFDKDALRAELDKLYASLPVTGEALTVQDDDAHSGKESKVALISPDKKIFAAIAKLATDISSIEMKARLLMFNQGVVATRLGRSGIPFQVFADEVSNLSQMSTNVAQRIIELAGSSPRNHSS